MQLVYLYDGTLNGFFSCVYESYVRKDLPDLVCEESMLQFGFEQRLVSIGTNEAHAARVVRGLAGTCGEETYRKVHKVFLSFEHNRATMLMRFVHTAFAHGRAVEGMLAHPDVLPVDKMFCHIGREQQRFTQFLRFERMENGVYYGRIQPMNNVLPLIMPHFADRFTDQPFLIYNPVHKIAGVYDLNDWYLVETDQISLPEAAEDEREWKARWKRFYQAIAIKERRNEKLRRSLCPKRYWADMLEMPAVIRQ
jgi:probable DNA metabolism protein